MNTQETNDSLFFRHLRPRVELPPPPSPLPPHFRDQAQNRAHSAESTGELRAICQHPFELRTLVLSRCVGDFIFTLTKKTSRTISPPPLSFQVEGNEYRITADLVCSRVLEQLIQLCTTAQLTKLFASFVPELERMLTNRYASHVL